MQIENYFSIIIDKYVDKSKPIIIYPFGKYGKLIKEILNEKWNIQETAVIDNYLAKKNDSIFTSDFLADVNSNMTVVVACSKGIDKNKIIESIVKYKLTYVDFFSEDKLKMFAKYQRGYCPCCGQDTFLFNRRLV